MIKRVTALVIAVISIAINSIPAQEKKSEEGQASKEMFLKQMAYLMADDGIWEADNPAFNKDEQYSAKAYKYEMSKGVHGEQFRIKILSDINGLVGGRVGIAISYGIPLNNKVFIMV